ncbi:MAG TPA: uroporphyrinogen decarboxylase [Spirochaetia bacterium]
MSSAAAAQRVPSPFLAACRGEATARTPVWLMRQAGRYLPEYRDLRARHSMAALLGTPELAVEATLLPLRCFPLDAAIVFSDLLQPLVGMGLDVSYDDGGPVVANPLRAPRDIDMLAVPPAAEALETTLAAVRMAAAECAARGVPLIGFAGAPFTLASYAIEGGTSRSFTRTKAMMYGAPAAWERLMGRLVTVLSDFLIAQARAGASALQVFDSWAGIALGRDDYVRYAQPWTRRLFEGAKTAGVPLINFSTGTAAFIEEVAACGGDVVSVDWRMPMSWYREALGPDRVLQGNLDPAALLGPWRLVREGLETIRAGAGCRHIFNLGHGVLPETDPSVVARLVDAVHDAEAGA